LDFEGGKIDYLSVFSDSSNDVVHLANSASLSVANPKNPNLWRYNDVRSYAESGSPHVCEDATFFQESVWADNAGVLTVRETADAQRVLKIALVAPV
jgi:hypothetical protein